MPRTSTLAYMPAEPVTQEKSFIALTPGFTLNNGGPSFAPIQNQRKRTRVKTGSKPFVTGNRHFGSGMTDPALTAEQSPENKILIIIIKICNIINENNYYLHLATLQMVGTCIIKLFTSVINSVTRKASVFVKVRKK